MLEKVKEELEKRGYTVKLREAAVEIVLDGWSLVCKQTAEWNDPVEVADEITSGLGMNNVAAVALEKISDPEYIRNHVILCIRPQSQQQIVKKYYLDLEIYPLLVFEEGMGSVVTPKLAKLVEDTLEYAIANSEGSYFAEDLSMYAPETAGNLLEPIVISTNGYKFGAAAMYYTSIFEKYCKEHDTEECIIIPSSVHEIIVSKVPKDLSYIKEFHKKQCECLQEKDFLSDHLYKYSNGKIEVM